MTRMTTTPKNGPRVPARREPAVARDPRRAAQAAPAGGTATMGDAHRSKVPLPHALHRTHNDLPERTRRQAATDLNMLLADAGDLTMQAKQAHWNVRGPNFIALHRLFDEVYAHAGEWTDAIAERIAALGGQAYGTVQAAAQSSRLDPYPLDLAREEEHVDRLSMSLAKFGAYVREAIDDFLKLGDQDSADLCIEISRAADKDLWFVEAHLSG